jgi:hypothetical protein
VVILIHLLRWFSVFFGTTVARPEEEKKWAVYLACLLIFVFGVAALGLTVLFKLLFVR